MFEKKYGPDKTGSEFEPWITRESIDLLDNLLRSEFVGLEWGSGSSSIWYLERLSYLYTIEHDILWKDKVEKYILENKIELYKNWDIKCIIKDQIPSDKLYFDCDGISRKKYCLAEHVPNNLDFISIDGRSRRGCIDVAVKKIKEKNGILLLDNSDRQEYYPNAIPNNWEKIETTNGVWKTTIWISR